MYLDVVIPCSLTAEEFETIVEFDSQVETSPTWNSFQTVKAVTSHKRIVHQTKKPNSLCFQNSYVLWTFSRGYARIVAFTVDMRLNHKIERDLQVEVANQKTDTG